MADGDSLRKVRSGDPLKIPARAYNAFVDAAVAQRHRDQDRRRDIRPSTRNLDIIDIRNTSGEARERFDVLALAEPIIDPLANERQFLNRVAFNGVVPQQQHASTGRFAILLEPLKAGAIGKAAIGGVCPAWVLIEDPEHQRVDVEPGAADHLVSKGAGDTARPSFETKEDAEAAGPPTGSYSVRYFGGIELNGMDHVSTTYEGGSFESEKEVFWELGHTVHLLEIEFGAGCEWDPVLGQCVHG